MMTKAKVEIRVVYKFKDKFNSAAGHVKADETFYVTTYHAESTSAIEYEARFFANMYCKAWMRIHIDEFNLVITKQGV